jgi:hypothetical protein
MFFSPSVARSGFFDLEVANAASDIFLDAMLFKGVLAFFKINAFPGGVAL